MRTANIDLATSNALASWNGMSHLVSVFCFFFAIAGSIKFFKKNQKYGLVRKFLLSLVVILFSVGSLLHGSKSYEGDIVLYGWSPLFATVFEWITAIVSYHKTSIHQSFVDIGAVFTPGATNHTILFRSGLSFVYGLSVTVCFLVYYSFSSILINFYDWVIFSGIFLCNKFHSDPKTMARHRMQYASTKSAGVDIKFLSRNRNQ